VPKVAFDFSGTGAGAPRSNPSVLMSSSISGQWMPYPPPAIFPAFQTYIPEVTFVTSPFIFRYLSLPAEGAE
jgi:hypothetical protein